jgi:hypothetical protein
MEKRKIRRIRWVNVFGLSLLVVIVLFQLFSGSPLLAKSSLPTSKSNDDVLLESKLKTPLNFKSLKSVDVSSWEDFVHAMADATVSQINIIQDISLSGVLTNYDDLFSKDSVDMTANQNSYLYINKNATARAITINGNNHTFDFGNLSIGFLNASSYQNGSSGSIAGYWKVNFESIHLVSSNYSGPFSLTSHSGAEVATEGLTGSIRSNATIYYDSSTTTNTRRVSDFLGYSIAINDYSVGNIKIESDLVSTKGIYNSNYYIYSNYTKSAANVSSVTSYANNSAGETHVMFNLQGNARSLIVDGQGYTIDFGAICFDFTSSNNAGGAKWDITYSNMNVYHGNYFGTMIFNNGSNGGTMRFDNYVGVGNQFLESTNAKVVMKNTVSMTQQNNWTSIGKDGTPIRTWALNNELQQNLNVSDVSIEANAKIKLESRGTNIVTVDSGGNFVVGDNATVDMIRGDELNASEGNRTNLEVRGSVVVNSGAKVNLLNHNKNTGSALVMNAAGANLDVAEGGNLNIVTDNYKSSGNGVANNPIYFNSGKINVNGDLSINGSNMESSGTSMLYASNSVSFTIGKNGTFDVQSDSNSTSQYLLYMSGATSTFQFTDAKRVNLQRNANLLSGTATNNGLIYSAGTLDVSVQNVYQWSLGNMDDTLYDYGYEPMSSMLLSYSGYNSTVTSANSMTNETLNKFKSNFSTRGQQRVLFTQITDPSISIKSISNDNHNDNGSYTIFGYAIPNTYIRIWEEPLNGTTSAKEKGSGDNIKSPVEDLGMPQETRDNYTVQADKDGNWTYTIDSDKYFTAGNIIHAYGFSNLKSEEDKQIVLDKTAPLASPVTYYISKGDNLPEAKEMVKDVSDSSPINTGFDYVYTDLAAAQNAANVTGTHNIQISVSDKAVDGSGAPSPNTTIVESSLVVYESTQAVTGSDFDASYVDIRNLTDEQLINYILKQSQPSAYSIVNGKKNDLSSFVTVTDFGGLNNTSALQPKTYPVTLTVKASDSGLSSDISTTIYVTVGDVDAILHVEFVNEANQILSGYSVDINTQVGNTVDLTENESVQTQVNNVTAAGYDIAERPVNEKAVIMDNTSVTVQYKLQGILSLTSVPNSLDFGTLTYNATTKRIDNPSYDEQLVVTDTRADAKNGWRMTASLTSPMQNSNGQVLVNALRFVNDGKEVILNQASQVVYTNTKGISGSYIVSDNWGTTAHTDGIKLQINSSDKVYTGDYVGIITWKVMAGQP